MERGILSGRLRPHLGRALAAIAAAAAALAFGGAHAQAVQGVTDTEILLGTHQDLSGPAASFGGPMRDGLMLAVEEINAAGGIHGRKIRLLVEDSGYDPKRAALVTQKLVTQDKVFAMISTLGSPTSLASMPIALDRGVPMLFSSGAAESSYLPYHPLKFGLLAPGGPQARAAVRYAIEKLGRKRFGLLYQDDESGIGVAHAVEAQLKAHGMSLAEKTSYKRGEIDFSAPVARLKAAKVDVVMLATVVRETAAVAIEAKKQGLGADLIAPTGSINPATLKLGGEALEGMYVTTQWVPIAAQERTPALNAVLDRFRSRFGRDAEDGVNLTYTAMMLFAEGARNAGPTLTAQTLQHGLEKIKDWTPVFAAAPISYSAGNHAPPDRTLLLQIRGGKYTVQAAGITY